MKRLFDIALSLLGLIVLSPVFVAIALLIKLGSRGPIFYLGVRVGRNNKPFQIYKFRTMVVNAEKLGPTSTAEDDPRISKAGKVLRRCKLDELPQLLNVLLGQMSFVGPRPQVQWAVDLYTGTECELLTVSPGITDYASLVFRNEGELLRGSTDPDKDYLEKIAPEKIRLGLLYVQHRNLWIDIKIIIATIGAILGVDPTWCLRADRQSNPHERFSN